MCGSDNYETSNTVLLTLVSKWLEVRLIELILRFSKVVITSKIAVWSVRLLSHFYQSLISNTISSIHVSIEFESFALLLELKETINDIVASWCSIAAEDEADLTTKLLGAHGLEFIIKLMN